MKLGYHGDSGIVEPRGNVLIQTQTPAQGILSAIAISRQLNILNAFPGHRVTPNLLNGNKPLLLSNTGLKSKHYA